MDRGAGTEGAVRIAALDYGSNTAGYLIGAERAGEAAPRFLERRSEFVRLADGLSRTGRLGDAAVERALAWTRAMRADLDRAGVRAIRAVGTEALRRARDAARFLEPAREILGVPIEILSGDEEGRCCFRGVRTHYPTGGLAVLDIGGGSTELYVASEGVDRGPAVEGFSARLGAVTATDLHGEDRAALRRLVEDGWRGPAAPSRLPTRTLTVLGGTATNCALLHLRRSRVEDAALEGLELSADEVCELAERVARTPVPERAASLGIPAGRADVAVAGFEILIGAMRVFGFERVRTSRACLRHGVLLDLFESRRRA